MERPKPDSQPENSIDNLDHADNKPLDGAFDSVRNILEKLKLVDKDDDVGEELTDDSAKNTGKHLNRVPGLVSIQETSEVSAETHIEKPTLSSSERRERVQEILSKTASNEIDSRMVLEKTAAAAEQNVPIETYYERRHEAKDESTKASPSTGLGRAMNGGEEPGAASEAVTPSIDELEKKLLRDDSLQESKNSKTGLYKKAVLSGLITAAVIVAITLAILIANR